MTKKAKRKLLADRDSHAILEGMAEVIWMIAYGTHLPGARRPIRYSYAALDAAVDLFELYADVNHPHSVVTLSKMVEDELGGPTRTGAWLSSFGKWLAISVMERSQTIPAAVSVELAPVRNKFGAASMAFRQPFAFSAHFDGNELRWEGASQAGRDRKPRRPNPTDHTRDEDCTVVDDECTGCGVWHGDPCEDCGGRGYHRAPCEVMRTDLCIDCEQSLDDHTDEMNGDVVVTVCPSRPNPGVDQTAARAKLFALAERRKKRGRTCDDPSCPGWIVSESGEHGLRVERCDDCWRPFPTDQQLHDEEAAALPEAQKALAAEFQRNPAKFVGGVAPPTYDERRGWIGGDSKTLYAFTDKRTGSVTVRPGGGPRKPGLHRIGPEATVRIATRAEAEAHWQDPLHPGWVVANENPLTYAGPVRSTQLFARVERKRHDGTIEHSYEPVDPRGGWNVDLYREVGPGQYKRVNPRR